MEHAKEFCCNCSWQKIGRVKNIVAALVGVLVLLSSLFSIVNIFTVLFEPLDFIRFVWNGLFGVLIVLLELNWVEWVTLRFGFLEGWFGRGMFFLYVGTVVMDPDASLSTALFSFVVGGGSIFVGCVELLVGFKCSPDGTLAAGQQRRAAQVRPARTTRRLAPTRAVAQNVHHPLPAVRARRTASPCRACRQASPATESTWVHENSVPQCVRQCRLLWPLPGSLK